MRYFKIIKNTKFHLAVIAVLTILAYSSIFQNQLVVDDGAFLKNWPGITDIRRLVGGDLPSTVSGVYRPIRSLLYAVYYHFWGSNPLGYHFHSILVHLISTFLVYFIVLEILKRVSNLKLVAFIAALLFGLHPIHTEAITYLSASMDTTGIMLILASFFFYIRGRIYSSLLLAALAIFTNELAFILPLLIILYDFCFNRKNPHAFGKKIKYYFGFLGIIAVYFFTRFYLIHLPLSRGDYMAKSFYHTLIFMPKIFVWYIWLLFVPVNLSFIHTLAPGFETYMNGFSHFESILSKSPTDLDILGSILILVSLLLLGVYFFKKHSLISFGIFWFFISMLPVSYLVPVGPALSERYLYLASLGPILIAVSLLASLYRKIKNVELGYVFVFAASVILILFGIETYTRNLDWRNPGTLYLSILRIYPQSLIASYYLGIYYSDTLDWKNAERAYQRVLSIEPKFYEARFNLANTYNKLGKLDGAEKEYMKIHQIAPNFLDSYINLGILYGKEGKKDQEIAKLQQGLAIDPTKYEILGVQKSQSEIITKFALIHSLLGHLYEEKNDPDLAAKQYTKALQLNPALIDAQAGLDALVSKNPLIKNSLPANILLEYKTGFGLVFRYPAVWKVQNQGEKVMLENEKGNFFIQLQVEQMFQESADQFLASQKTLGTLINQGTAKIPNFDYAYVKIWTTDQNIQGYQFFLFKGNKALEVIAFPIDAAFIKGNFDSFISSMRME